MHCKFGSYDRHMTSVFVSHARQILFFWLTRTRRAIVRLSLSKVHSNNTCSVGKFPDLEIPGTYKHETGKLPPERT